LVHQKLEAWNKFYDLKYNKVAIRNQRSRWGSCSKKGNLNFNYRILRLPPELQDYIIVHELCHLAQFDHSKAFWALVAKTIPDYVARRRLLVTYAKSGLNPPALG
jgi:predicted metal-dependent hydrolase